MTQRIERDIFIAAPTDVVWRAVTEPDQVRRWFADEVELVAEPGEDGKLSFNHDDAPQSTYLFTVQSVEPERVFSYRWQHQAGTEADETNSVLVQFLIAPEADGTRLRVVESGMEAMGWSEAKEAEYVADHSSGWTHFLERLEHFVTTGAAA